MSKHSELLGGKPRPELEAEADRALLSCIDRGRQSDGSFAVDDPALLAEMADWWRAHADVHGLYRRQAQRHIADYFRRQGSLRLDTSVAQTLADIILLADLAFSGVEDGAAEAKRIRKALTPTDLEAFAAIMNATQVRRVTAHAARMTQLANQRARMRRSKKP